MSLLSALNSADEYCSEECLALSVAVAKAMGAKQVGEAGK